MTRILATGKSGTIGRYLPTEVIGIDFRKEPIKSEINRAIEDEQFSIIHLAGVVGETLTIQSKEESRRVNVAKSVQLAECCVERRLRRFFYISTSHVYSKSDNPISEITPLNPHSEYAKQKLESEIELTKIFREFPEKLCILRVFSVLSLESREFTLGAAIKRAATNSQFKIYNVDDERDFLHPRQIVEIILKLVPLHDLPQVINICSGTAISVREGIQQIAKHKNFRISPEQLISGRSESPRILGDATLLKSLLRQDDLGFKCLD